MPPASFLQAVESFVNSVVPVFDRYPKYAWVMKTLMEPERVIQVCLGRYDPLRMTSL